jgi:hypothetical protein
MVVLDDVVAPRGNRRKVPEAEVRVQVLTAFDSGAAPRDGGSAGCPDLGTWVHDRATPHDKS